MVLEFYICFLASFQLLTSASVCKKGQKCFNCSTDGLCVSACHVGFYGQSCNNKCSANCLHGKCTDGEIGIERCILGCKPGYTGSRCTVPCTAPSANDTCKKCPDDCKEGFCDLGTSCMSGCVDGYYGAEGCHSGCWQNCSKTSFVKVFTVYYYVAGAVGVLVFVSMLGLVIYLSHRMKRVDTILNHIVRWSRGNELEATEPEVNVSTPCTASLTDSCNTTVVEERRREVIPNRPDSEMEDFIDAFNAVSEFDDEVGSYSNLRWNAYR